MTPEEIAATLRDRSVLDVDSGCWRWTGAHVPKGYGQMRVNGQRQAVHRLAHEVWIGPIPEGYEVDHVHEAGCVHRDCVNPAHLEAVTHAENVRRQLAARPAVCPQGHPMTEENVILGTNGRGYPSRRCRTCHKLRQAEARRKSRG